MLSFFLHDLDKPRLTQMESQQSEFASNDMIVQRF